MSAARIIKNPSIWVSIMNTNPSILKDQAELNLSDLKTLPPINQFQDVMDVLISGKITNQFCLNLSSYDHGASQNNVLTKSYFQLIANALISGKCPVNFQLNLSFTWLISDAEKIQLLTNALKSSQCPKGFSLDLSRNYLHNYLNYFTGVLIKCPVGFQLCLDSCHLDDNDIITLVKEIVNPECNLQVLSLKNNKITNEGALLILAVITKKGYSDLKLDLSGNEIDPQILSEITLQLEKNRTNYSIACAVIQQGLDCKKSRISKLPQSVANHIYQFLMPVESPKIRFFENKLKSKMHKKEIKQEIGGNHTSSSNTKATHAGDDKASSICCAIL